METPELNNAGWEPVRLAGEALKDEASSVGVREQESIAQRIATLNDQIKVLRTQSPTKKLSTLGTIKKWWHGRPDSIEIIVKKNKIKQLEHLKKQVVLLCNSLDKTNDNDIVQIQRLSIRVFQTLTILKELPILEVEDCSVLEEEEFPLLDEPDIDEPAKQLKDKISHFNKIYRENKDDALAEMRINTLYSKTFDANKIEKKVDNELEKTMMVSSFIKPNDKSISEFEKKLELLNKSIIQRKVDFTDRGHAYKALPKSCIDRFNTEYNAKRKVIDTIKKGLVGTLTFEKAMMLADATRDLSNLIEEFNSICEKYDEVNSNINSSEEQIKQIQKEIDDCNELSLVKNKDFFSDIAVKTLSTLQKKLSEKKKHIVIDLSKAKTKADFKNFKKKSEELSLEIQDDCQIGHILKLELEMANKYEYNENAYEFTKEMKITAQGDLNAYITIIRGLSNYVT